MKYQAHSTRNQKNLIIDYAQIDSKYTNGVYGENFVKENPMGDLRADMVKKIISRIESMNDELDIYGDSLRGVKARMGIKKLNTRYTMQFSKVSVEFEKWASQRRMLIKMLNKAIQELETIKQVSCRTRFLFSGADVIGTLGAMFLDQCQISGSRRVLYSASFFGCLSFVATLVDAYKTNSIMENILKEFRQETDSLHRIQTLLQDMDDFEREVDDLFPYGVNIGIVKMIQEPDRPKLKRQKSLQELIQLMSRTKENTQISLAILLSNGKENHSLLEDKDFLTKVQAFSNSTTAEKWWNRLKYRGLLPISQKTRLFAELNSFARIDSLTIQSFPLLSPPVWNTYGLSTIASLLLNGLVAFDAYSEMEQNKSSKEVDILTRMKKELEAEYSEMMTVYKKLSPHCD